MNTWDMADLAPSQLPPSLEGAQEGDLVGVLQLAAHRHAVGDSRHAHAHGLDQPGDVGRGGFALHVGVGGQHDLPDLAGGQALHQFADADVVRAHAVHR